MIQADVPKRSDYRIILPKSLELANSCNTSYIYIHSSGSVCDYTQYKLPWRQIQILEQCYWLC